MISYTQALTNLQQWLKYDSNDTTTNTFVMGLFNDSIRAVCIAKNWWFLGYSKDITAQAGIGTYPIPARVAKIIETYVTVGSTVYRPQPVYNEETWTRIKQGNYGESDTPMFYRVKDNSLEFEPKFASTTPVITVRGRFRPRDISIADYTTGNISAVTNGGTTVTGSGTSWNSTMVGRMIRITNLGTTNAGDGVWYEISAVASTTSLTLAEPYEGTTISAGSAAYNISETFPIPEEWQLAPIYRTVALYQAINDPANPKVSQMWWRMYDGGKEAGLTDKIGGILGNMIESEGSTIEDKYLQPYYKDIDPNYPPRDVSGFS